MTVPNALVKVNRQALIALVIASRVALRTEGLELSRPFAIGDCDTKIRIVSCHGLRALSMFVTERPKSIGQRVAVGLSVVS